MKFELSNRVAIAAIICFTLLALLRMSGGCIRTHYDDLSPAVVDTTAVDSTQVEGP